MIMSPELFEAKCKIDELDQKLVNVTNAFIDQLINSGMSEECAVKLVNDFALYGCV